MGAGYVRVFPAELSSVGARLAGSPSAVVPVEAVPAGGDVTSAAMAAILTAHGAVLSTVLAHAVLLRAAGGANLIRSAVIFQLVDERNAARVLASIGVHTSAPTTDMPPAVEVPSAPVVPVIPALPPPVVLPGEALAVALHGGPGSSSTRLAADQWRTQAGAVEELADQTRSQARAITAAWDDGGRHRAADNTWEHGLWLHHTATHMRALARAADSHADAFDRAKHATPTPQEFAATRDEIAAAQARADPIALAQATSKYADQQTQATQAATTYHAEATTTATAITTTPNTAPPIVRGGGVSHTDYATARGIVDTDSTSASTFGKPSNGSVPLDPPPHPSTQDAIQALDHKLSPADDGDNHSKITPGQIMEQYQVGDDPDGMADKWEPPWPGSLFTTPQDGLTASEAQMLDRLGLLGLRDMQQMKEAAQAEALERFPATPDGSEIDNHLDAFRHAYWNALMTERFGEEWTREFTTAHERRPGNFASSEAMDLWNNEVGRGIATANPDASPDQLADMVEQAVRSGETVVVRPDGRGVMWSDQIPVGGPTGDSSVSPPVGGGTPSLVPTPWPEGTYDPGQPGGGGVSGGY